MNSRIKELRKALNMKQEAFADSISLSRNYVSLVENGDRNLADRTVSDICRIHNVSEEWLRTGEGEMFLPMNRDEELSKIVMDLYQNDPSDLAVKLMRVVSRMSDDQIEALVEVARDIVSEYEKSSSN